MEAGQFVGFSMMACVTSVVVIALILGVGALLARNDLLSDKSIAQFSKLVAFVFLPCLLFDKVTSAVSGTESLLDLLSLTLFAIAHHVVAHFVSWIVFQFPFFSGKEKSPLTKRLLINATSFQNVLYIPLTFLSTLCDQPDLWGTQTTIAKSKAVGYIGMYVVIWQIILWTWGFSLFRCAARDDEKLQNEKLKNIQMEEKSRKNTTMETVVVVDERSTIREQLKQAEETISKENEKEKEMEKEKEKETISNEEKPNEIPNESIEIKKEETNQTEKIETKMETSETNNEIQSENKEQSEQKSSPNPSEIQVVDSTTTKINNSNETTLTLRTHDHNNRNKDQEQKQPETNTKPSKEKHKSHRVVPVQQSESTFKFVFITLVKNPPVISVLIAITFSLIPGAKENLYTDPPVPLLAIPRNFIQIVGGAATPLALISIGTKLANRPRLQDVPIAGLLASIAIRLLLVPGVFLPITMAIFQANIVSQQTVIFFMVVMIQTCTPLSLDIALHTQLVQAGREKTAALLFYHYLCALFTVPLFACLFLYIAFQHLNLPAL